MRKNLSDLPFIGPLFLRRKVKKLVLAAQHGDIPSVRILAGITAYSADPVTRRIAGDCLSSISSQEAIDLMCTEVLLQKDTILLELVCRQGYAPLDPAMRALFLFMTGQSAAFSRHDTEAHHPLLAKGYNGASSRIRSRALRYAKDPCHGKESRSLARALLGTDPDRAARRWSYGEWELVMGTLIEDMSWDMLWALVSLAPPSLSLTALHEMNHAGWHPGGNEREVFAELVRDLPERWNAPMIEKPLDTRELQEGRAIRLAFSFDGSLLAAGSCDGTIAVWQVASGRLRFSCKTGVGSPHFLAFTPDNTLLISGGDRGGLQATGPSGETIWIYEDPHHAITNAILLNDSDEVLAGDANGFLLRFDLRTGVVRCIMPSHSSPITTLASIRGSQILVTGHADGTVCCLDSLSGTVRWATGGAGAPVRTLAISNATGGILVVHGYSLPVLLSGETGEPERTFSGHTGRVSCTAISPDAGTIVVGGDPNMLRIWNADEHPSVAIPFYNRAPSICTITPDVTHLIACCSDGTIIYLDLPDGVKKKEFRAYRCPVSACSLSQGGRYLAIAGSDGTVTLRSVPEGELFRTLRRPAAAVTALTLAGEDAKILAGTSDGTVRIVALEHDTTGRSIDCYTPSVLAVAASPDGKILACSGKEHSLRFWDIQTGSLLVTCSGLKTTVRCLAILPDGKTCISGGWDGIVRSWDIPSGTVREVRTGHTSIVTCCAVCPSGDVFVTGSNDTTVRIWDIAGEKDPVVIHDADTEVRGCAISPDSILLATAGEESVIRLYYLPEGTRAGTLPQVPGTPTVLVFSTDGLTLAVGYANGILAFYAVHDRVLIRTVPAHTGAVTGIVALPGETEVVTSGEDGRVHKFMVPHQHALSIADQQILAQAREQSSGTGDTAAQWRFLHRLLSLRFQNEIELCPTTCDTGTFDIQIVG